MIRSSGGPADAAQLADAIIERVGKTIVARTKYRIHFRISREYKRNCSRLWPADG
jgi:hypothetical protein